MSNEKKLHMSLVGDTARQPTWSFVGGWNYSLDQVQEYPARARDYLWASQLGKSQVDIFLTLAGMEVSNPFGKRAKRKFDAGVMWEWIAEMVAKRAGIFISSQDYVRYAVPGGLEVSGKLDLRLGGVRNLEQIKSMKDALGIIGLPDRFVDAMKVVEDRMNFTTELPERIIEVKSSSAYMYDAQYKFGIPAENHALQCLHYLLATGNDEGAILYISKDDARMTEIPIWRDDELLNAKYKEVVTLAKMYYDKKEKPPVEPLITFDWAKGRFSDNWNVKYSGYLTYLYGFETEGDYQDAYKGQIASWNRVLGRAVRGERMTDKNIAYIGEIKGTFNNFDDIITHFRAADVENHEEGYVIGGGEK